MMLLGSNNISNNDLGCSECTLADGEITAESKPEYDVPFWPFDTAWSCEEWKAWHKALKKEHGLETANNMFLNAWERQGSFEWNVSWCKYGRDFVEYFKQQGLEPGNWASSIFHNTTKTAENVTKATAGLGTGTIKTLLLVGGLGVGAYFLSPFMPIVKDKIKEITQ